MANGDGMLHLNDRGSGKPEDAGMFSVSFKSKTLRVSSLIALLTAVGGLFVYQKKSEQPAAFYSPDTSTKLREHDARLDWLEKHVESIDTNLTYLRLAEERRQGREEAGRRR